MPIAAVTPDLEVVIMRDVDVRGYTITAGTTGSVVSKTKRLVKVLLTSGPQRRQTLDFNPDSLEPVVKLRVVRALQGLTGEQLSQEVILKQLEDTFGGKQRLHEVSKKPEFAEALLEAVRTKQTETWKGATKIHDVGKSDWTSQEKQHWSARHYTNKFIVVLGEDLGDGTFAIRDVQPPPFKELLSSITLATMDRAGAAASGGCKRGDSLMLTFSSGAASSGHTTGKDWKNIGNVGDTFFGLFYKDEPATGLVPAFIKDAVYYATWSLDEFGLGWASSDWLATAAGSQTENAATPPGKARQGELSDIVADIFPAAATRDFGDTTGGRETEGSQSARRAAFAAMENFEVKKHGSMAIKEWLPVAANVNQIKNWSVDATTGGLVKLKTKLESSEATSESALLASARHLGLITHGMDGKEEVYTWKSRKFNGEPDLAKDAGLFGELTRAVEEARAARREEELRVNESSRPAAAPPPPSLPPPKQKVAGGTRTLTTIRH
jgi:hypothetical protein